MLKEKDKEKFNNKKKYFDNKKYYEKTKVIYKSEGNNCFSRGKNIRHRITAYLDPGTGTMLLSVLITIFSCIVFTAQILYLKLKKFIGNDGDDISDNCDIVIYSEGKQYWNIFESILDEFEKRKILINFYTSDKEDFVFKKNYQYVNSKYIGNKSISYIKLSVLNANVCLMTTPNLNVFQLKRSKNVKHYSHMVHALGSLLNYRLYGLDYYDSVLCSSEIQAEEIKKLEDIRNSKKKELVITGCTYLDKVNKNNVVNENNSGKIIARC